MRAMKAQHISRDRLPWTAPFQPYLTYVSLGLTVLICTFKGFDSFMPWSYKSFITHYIGIPVFALSYAYFRCECCLPFGISSLTRQSLVTLKVPVRLKSI